MACSALKRAYREAILAVEPRTEFILLDGARELLEQRLAARHGHFMPQSLLDSQLETLEPIERDEPGITVPIDRAPREIADDIRSKLASL